MGFLDMIGRQGQRPAIEPEMAGAGMPQQGLLMDPSLQNQPGPYRPGSIMPDPAGPNGMPPAMGGDGIDPVNASEPGPKKPGLLERIGNAVQSDSWSDFAAELQHMGGDTEAYANRRAEREAASQKAIRDRATEDMEAEAKAARAAMEGGGWNSKRFMEVWGDRPRPPDPQRLAAYAKLYGPETGITSSGVPWSRTQEGQTTWGTPAPETPAELARREEIAQRNRQIEEDRLRRDEDRDADRELRRLLGLGNLDYKNKHPPGSGRQPAGGGGIPPPPPGGRRRPPKGTT